MGPVGSDDFDIKIYPMMAFFKKATCASDLSVKISRRAAAALLGQSGLPKSLDVAITIVQSPERW